MAKNATIKDLNERKLWHKLKEKTKSISWIRIENWALPGTPDLLGYSKKGNFFTLELKVTTIRNHKKVAFSPHQISFHVKHKKNTYVLVAWALGKLVRLYPGSQILDLLEDSELEPLACGLDSCATLLEDL